MKSNKLSQIKFGETIGVIIIVYIIIMVGLIWFNNINNSDISDMSKKNLENKAFEKYQFVINFDLIHKSERGDIDEEFDLISLRALSNYSKTKIGEKYLSYRLSFSTITVDIYNKSVFSGINDTNMQESLILYNKTPNSNREISDVIIYKTLIPIRDNIINENDIGVIYIKSYIIAK